MEEENKLIAYYPDILSIKDLPCILLNTQTLSGTLKDENGNYIKYNTGIHAARIELYDNLVCTLNYAPKKHISRSFD